MTGVILAHQGGWDEILMVLGPVVVIVALLRLAKKRVERRSASSDDSAPANALDGSRGPTSTRG